MLLLQCTLSFVILGWLSGRGFTSNAGDWGSIPDRNRPKLKQVVTVNTAKHSATSVSQCHGSLEITIIKAVGVAR